MVPSPPAPLASASTSPPLRERSPRTPRHRLVSHLRRLGDRLSCSSPVRDTAASDTRGRRARARAGATAPTQNPSSLPPTTTTTDEQALPQDSIPPTTVAPVTPPGDLATAAAAATPLPAQPPSTATPPVAFRPATLSRLRRKCHSCSSPFIFGESTCQRCNHRLCPQCPLETPLLRHGTVPSTPTPDPALQPASLATPSASIPLPIPPEPGSAPGVSDDAEDPPLLFRRSTDRSVHSASHSRTASAASSRQRTYKKSRQRIHHICHLCASHFGDADLSCNKCQHARCHDCTRAPESRRAMSDLDGSSVPFGDGFDAEVVAVVRRRLNGYVVESVTTVTTVTTMAPETTARRDLDSTAEAGA